MIEADKTAGPPMVWSGPEAAKNLLILAHGAGAPMDSPFMDYFARGIGKAGIRVVRFEFPYMAERRGGGKKRPPDRPDRLLAAWRGMVDQVLENSATDVRIFIGGKSMGGRMASLIADEMHQAGRVHGLICLGYPFHAPGRPDKPRTDHLRDLKCPALILQGERDAMGSRDRVAGYDLSDRITLHWADDGNHDLAPRKRSGFTEQGNWDRAIEKIAGFMEAMA